MAGGIGILAMSIPGGFDLWDITLSVMMFAAATLLIVSVFSQRGAVHLSPQREAAIATGHTDRKTVFESSYARPVLWMFLVMAHRLAMQRTKDWLRRTLVAAGSPNYYTSEEYLALAMASGAALGLLAEVVFLLLTGEFNLIIFIVALAFGAGLAIYQVHNKAVKRVREISRRVPYTLDLIALAMGAGATFTEAVKTVVREKTSDAFNVELKTLLAEMELGATRRRSLQNLSDRVPLESLRAIIASVIQAEELGTPLGEVLHEQATLMRLRRSFAAENRAAVASVRILLPCLLLVGAAVLAVFGPMIVRAVHGGLL